MVIISLLKNKLVPVINNTKGTIERNKIFTLMLIEVLVLLFVCLFVLCLFVCLFV